MTLKVRKIAMCAFFICVAALLSAAETCLPPICPLPGIRVGLGNVVTMFMLYIGGKWTSAEAMVVMILRCFVAAFITGGVMNLFYGVMGGICAIGTMLLLRRVFPKKNRENWLPLVGIGGALAHVTGQIITSVIIYGNLFVLSYTPILLLSAVIGGAFTGTCTMLLLKKLSPVILDVIRMTDLNTPTKPNPKEM